MKMIKNRGAVFVFIAAFLWSFAGVFTKFIPWSAMSITCVRGLVAAVTIGLVTRQWRIKLNFPILLGALGTITTSILFMTANKITSSANAIVLQYSAPAFVILLSAVFLKIKPSRLDILAVTATLGGIVLFFIEHLGHGALLGDLLAILSGLTFALVFFVNRLPGADAMKASYLGCMLNVLLIPFLFFDKGIPGAKPSVLFAVLVMGVFQLGFAYVAFSKGVRTTDALSASIISMAEPILNPIWVFLMMGEKPGPLAILGTFIVIVTILIYNILTVRKANISKAASASSPAENNT